MLERTQDAARDARSKLALLEADWSAPLRERLQGGAGRREQRMLDALGTSGEKTVLYALATIMCDLLSGTAELVERLDAASHAAWLDPVAGDADASAQAALSLAWSGRLRRALTSLTGGEGTTPSLPSDTRSAVTLAARKLDDLLDQLGAIIAALAGEFRGERAARERLNRAPSGRHAAILVLDIAGYTVHGEATDERTHNAWAREGLNLAAQWTCALGGRERPERKGDELVVEFPEDGDTSVLAAALIQCHTRALRLTGIEQVRWCFHAGSDCGDVQEHDGDVTGLCVTHASKIAKAGDGRTEASQVAITETLRDRCSTELQREPLGHRGKTVKLDDDGRYTLNTHMIESPGVIDLYVERLTVVAGRLLSELSAERPQAGLRAVPADPDEDQQSESQAG
jgi:hypothetical protein